MASLETYGTLGAIVKSRTGNKQVGFLTNRHVAVDLDYPNQKMFHPLPPNLGPGVYLGAVERATSFITDDVWYGIYAGKNPGKMSITTLVIFYFYFLQFMASFCRTFLAVHSPLLICYILFIEGILIFLFANIFSTLLCICRNFCPS